MKGGFGFFTRGKKLQEIYCSAQRLHRERKEVATLIIMQYSLHADFCMKHTCNQSNFHHHHDHHVERLETCHVIMLL